jgi:hypothetical protein
MHSSWIHVKLSLEVFPLKLETLLICIRERETQELVLQSISKVNNLCLVSKYSHVWVQAKDLQTIESKLTSVSRKEST